MSEATADSRWLQRACRLASKALGTTAPNPGVGCVLVREGVVLGEGRTSPATDTPQIHAEAAALAEAARRGHPTQGATAYVTLAPCTRRSAGGTACAELLIAAGITRVVIGADDPSQGTSCAHLTTAGVTAVCAHDPWAQHLHGGFLRRLSAKRPRFTGKWASTLDGFLATESGRSGWISSPLALALSRRRRRAFDAILIGSGTAKADDPQLLASHPRAKPLLRIVLNATADLDDDSHLLHTLDRAPLLVVHHPDADTTRLKAWGVELLAVADAHDLPAVARSLAALGLNDILVEGGAAIHGAFLAARLYDRLELYQGGTTLGGGLAIARGRGVPTIPDGQHWQPECPPQVLGNTILTRWCLPA
jgi:diaminohydroxyphosphoribosylaminopyrimidine deaminase/5-amino-6-(5-phosphoribosylamino)uracil reductase